MTLNVWLTLCLFGVMLLLVWPARRAKRDDDSIQPMSEEDWHINEVLAKRREERINADR
jgi:cbb3-type cytochrome oxidase subunit 3